MLGTTHLKVSLRASTSPYPFVPGERAWNEHRGGPETLLHWLETQLGLLAQSVPLSSRIIEFAGVLDAHNGRSYAESLTTDRWATATELLSRRDELRMAGWDDAESQKFPDLVNDLARAVKARPMAWPDTATRLKEVVAALDAGQCLPAHRVVLAEPATQWPVRWQAVLSRLHTEQAPAPVPAAPADTMLSRAQTAMISGETLGLGFDQSLRWVKSGSVFSGCEFVASVLARQAEQLSSTVIFCEDASIGICLDGCLNRLGLPTMGVSHESLAHPVFQVLPLTLKLMWEPVDPELLLAFLSLPVNPLGRRATWRLAEALSKQPGLGSSAWVAAVEQLCAEAVNEPESLREKLNAWLNGPRFRTGTSIPAKEVREACGRVARWATGLSTLFAEKQDVPPSLIEALRSVAGQASTLGELAESHGGELTEPQIIRLRDASMSFGGLMTPFPMTEAGPRFVTSLADIGENCSHLIWLGQSSGGRAGCRWPFLEWVQLAGAGIHLDDGTREQSILREAERRGLCRVSESLLAVGLPNDEDQKTHPIWLQIESLLPKQPPLRLEDLLGGDDTGLVAPLAFRTEHFDAKPPQPPRQLWTIPTGLLEDRLSSSASELEDRLACPLKWVFNYQARISRSAVASLPSDFQLKGIFCHSILQSVLGVGGELPDPDSAVRAVEAAFEERLPLDAAPLAQPLRSIDRHKLKDSLRRATRVLVTSLQQGGYRISGIEVEVTGTVQGRNLVGRIDCLAIRPNGDEAVIDFKYSGDRKYQKLIEEGRALQLATYAYGRSLQARAFPAVAYLIIDKARLISSTADRLEGQSSGIDGRGIHEVWEQFAEALAKAESWLSDSQPVPARPLQTPDFWPEGSGLVLKADLKSDEVQPVCQYCDYPSLCGRRELI